MMLTMTQTAGHSVSLMHSSLFNSALDDSSSGGCSGDAVDDDFFEIVAQPGQGGGGGGGVRKIQSFFYDSSSSSVDTAAPVALQGDDMLNNGGDDGNNTKIEAAAAAVVVVEEEQPVPQQPKTAKKRRPKFRLTLRRASKRPRRERQQQQPLLQEEVEEEEEEEEEEAAAAAEEEEEEEEEVLELPEELQRQLLQSSDSEDTQSRRVQPRRECHKRRKVYRENESDDEIVPERDLLPARGIVLPTTAAAVHAAIAAPTMPDQERKKAPLRNASTNLYGFINHFLQSRIEAQGVAVSHVATQVAALLTRTKSAYGVDRALLTKLVLCGPTGCGKTETTLALKNLLGMDPGYEYERQCVDIDGSTMGNETQVNCLTGGAAGLVGYHDGGSLAERLLQALHSYNTTEWQQLQRMNVRTKAYATAKAAYEEKVAKMPDAERYPPYLMLCIDEVDKVAKEFMLNINGLLETGHYQTPSGISFVLPHCTRLLIVMTSNYGDTAICEMRQRNTSMAIKLVEQDMQLAQLSKFTIERMGGIVVYYPLAPETLKKILTEKLRLYMEEMSQSLWEKFGGGGENAVLLPTKFLIFSETIRASLIENVLAEIDVERGLRNALRKLFETLETLFTRAGGELSALIQDRRLATPLQHPVVFTRCLISCHTLDKQLAAQSPPPDLSDAKKRLYYHITQRLCEDPLNAERVDICRHLNQKIEVLSLTVAEFPLVSVVPSPDNSMPVVEEPV